MKFKSIIIGLLLLCTFSFVACTRDEGMDDNSGSVNDNNTNTNYDNNANNDNTSNNNTNTDTNTNTNGDENNDAVTSASRANSVESFKNAVENSWIVIVEKDLEIPEDVTLKAGLKKTLGAFDLITLGVGAIIGSGIFTVIGIATVGP